MRILGIESSCDDTSVALLEARENDFFVVAEKTATQIDIHAQYGGVVPEVAGRQHAEYIFPLIEEVMKGQTPDVIAVTSGPGLITSLLVGVQAAKCLSYLWSIPLISINHIEGHIYSPFIEENNESLQLPALCLIVSGGHTELILMKDHGVYEYIGKTRDDAVGESFDKVGTLVGLSYPGGPKISAFAKQGNEKTISFPRPMMQEDTFDFSFAGLKTSALYWLEDNARKNSSHSYELPSETLKNFCASFEQAVVDVLINKTIRAAIQYRPSLVILGGGVSANEKLRQTLERHCATIGIPLKIPALHYATDNGAMIARAAFHHAKKNEYTRWKDISVNPNWKLNTL